MTYKTFVPRRARVVVTVTRPDSTGAPQEYRYQFSDHRMKIVIQQGGGVYGGAQVMIWGVPLASMNRIARLWAEPLTPQVTDRVEIGVWDGQDFVPIFDGLMMWSTIDASAMPDVKLVIEANSATQLAAVPVTPYSNPGPIALRDVLTSVAALGGMPLDYSDAIGEILMTDVRARGTPLDQVTSIMSGYKSLVWYVNLQRLVVLANDAPIGADSIRVAPDTGLIGWPAYSSSALQVSMLLNPKVRPGVTLEVISDFAFVTRTRWLAQVIRHEIDVNLPGGRWATSVACARFGSKAQAAADNAPPTN